MKTQPSDGEILGAMASAIAEQRRIEQQAMGLPELAADRSTSFLSIDLQAAMVALHAYRKVVKEQDA